MIPQNIGDTGVCIYVHAILTLPSGAWYTPMRTEPNSPCPSSCPSSSNSFFTYTIVSVFGEGVTSGGGAGAWCDGGGCGGRPPL